MLEKTYKKKHLTSFKLIIFGVCRSDPFGNRSADASIFYFR